MYSNIELKQKLIDCELCIDNEYLDLYVNLIVNKQTKHQRFKTQTHHIIPRFYYRVNNIPVVHTDNIVELMYKDHVLAHWYLARCSSNEYFFFANMNALEYTKVTNNYDSIDFILSDEELDKYQSDYEKFAKKLKQLSHTTEVNKKISDKMSGKRSPNLGNKRPTKRTKSLEEYERNQLRQAITDERHRQGIWGKRVSDEAKKKISEKNGFAVEMIDFETKQILKVFPSAKAAANYLISLGITSNKSANHRILITCKSNDLNNKAYGYSWRFVKRCND